jgi:hypothetical protein
LYPLLTLRTPPRPYHTQRIAATPTAKQRGLTRAELVWILGLSAFILGIIFWSWKTDLDQAQDRLGTQQMSYLAGQIRYAMEVQEDQLEQWPKFMLGPGQAPTGLQGVNLKPLDSVLPEYVYLPVDPWQGAYALQQRADGAWLLIGFGKDGEWSEQQDKFAFSTPIFPPM